MTSFKRFESKPVPPYPISKKKKNKWDVKSILKCERVSDCCLTQKKDFYSYIMAWKFTIISWKNVEYKLVTWHVSVVDYGFEARLAQT
jgi:hypothetical protein